MRLCKGKVQADRKLRQQEKQYKMQGLQTGPTPHCFSECLPDENVPQDVLEEIEKEKPEKPFRFVYLFMVPFQVSLQSLFLFQKFSTHFTFELGRFVHACVVF